MPISQPPISEDPVQSSWSLEITQLVNDIEQAVDSLQDTRGDTFPLAPQLGASHYLTTVIDTMTVGWYKYDTEDGWIKIS